MGRLPVGIGAIPHALLACHVADFVHPGASKCQSPKSGDLDSFCSFCNSNRLAWSVGPEFFLVIILSDLVRWGRLHVVIWPNHLKQAPQVVTKITHNYKRKSGQIDLAKRFE